MGPIDKNLYNNIQRTGERYETKIQKDLIALKTHFKHPYFNVAFIADGFDYGIKTTTDFFQNTSSRIILSKDIRFSEYKKYLESQGYFYAEDTVGMALELSNIETRYFGREIHEVTTAYDFAQWAIPVIQSFKLKNHEENLSQYLFDIAELRNYFLLRDKEPIASASLFQNGETIGIYNLCVKEKYRRQGIGCQLLLRLIEIAKGRGYSKVVLHSAKMGMNLYMKMGFNYNNTQGIFIKLL